MPHNPDNYKTVPACLEPSVKDTLEEVAKKKGFTRTKLVRMMIKYCLQNNTYIQNVISFGDPPPK